jgi:hypothetical protein
MLNHNTNQILHAIDEVVEVAERLDEENKRNLFKILDRIINLVENSTDHDTIVTSRRQRHVTKNHYHW